MAVFTVHQGKNVHHSTWSRIFFINKFNVCFNVKNSSTFTHLTCLLCAPCTEIQFSLYLVCVERIWRYRQYSETSQEKKKLLVCFITWELYARRINIKIRKIYGQTDLYLLPFMILFYSTTHTHIFHVFWTIFPSTFIVSTLSSSLCFVYSAI